MSSGCRLRRSFFAHLGSDISDLLNQVFFLVYHGKNYSQASVMDMPTDERVWHIQRLYKQLMEEKKAVDEANKAAKTRKR